MNYYLVIILIIFCFYELYQVAQFIPVISFACESQKNKMIDTHIIDLPWTT